MQTHEQQLGTFLSEEELHEFTGRKRRDCQKKALCHMGIQHCVRPDGSVAVLREHIRNVMGGDAGNPVHRRPDPQPNWGNVNA